MLTLRRRLAGLYTVCTPLLLKLSDRLINSCHSMQHVWEDVECGSTWISTNAQANLLRLCREGKAFVTGAVSIQSVSPELVAD
jgi:hypothetical protein